ncbi:hypothetical protein ACPCA8_36185 [Streptomyces capoamus]|uniref:hypothetical protein n=1 Tax=Streptomyces capoamus TaxID=68183 RepID=UPI003C2AF29D
MIPLAYLATVAVSVVVLAVALRPRRTPAPSTPVPPAPAPAGLPATAAHEIRVILAAAAQLAARLDTAA